MDDLVTSGSNPDSNGYFYLALCYVAVVIEYQEGNRK